MLPLLEITGGGHDWTEAAQRIHGLQHMVMAQAAARAFPHLYRELGEITDDMSE